MGVDAVMLVQHSCVLDQVEVNNLAGRLVSLFGADAFWLVKPDPLKGEAGHHALSIRPSGHYRTEGLPEAAQTLEVNWMMRYYGPGYERGNWPIIRGVAEFLEGNLPGSTVLYGGDSSDDYQSFDSAARTVYNEHFLTVGHDPYRAYSLRAISTPKCDFCGNRPFHNVGGGSGQTFWHCDGCDTRLIEDRSGQFQTVAGRDFFS